MSLKAKSNKKVVKSVKRRKTVSMGRVVIKASFNNICITFTDMRGRVLTYCTAGACGFKGSKKSTPYAGQMAATKAAENAVSKYGISNVAMYVNGPGNGREAAMLAVRTIGIKVMRIVDNTSLPHNGCRPRKKRRV